MCERRSTRHQPTTNNPWLVTRGTYAFYLGECTSWVQFRLRDTVAPEFDNAYGRGRPRRRPLGPTPANWDDNAKRLGPTRRHRYPRAEGARRSPMVTSQGRITNQPRPCRLRGSSLRRRQCDLGLGDEPKRRHPLLPQRPQDHQRLLRLARHLYSLRRTTQAHLHTPARFQQHKDPVSAGCYCDAERGEEPLAGFEELVDGFDGPGGGYCPGYCGGDVHDDMAPGGGHLHSSEAAAGERRAGADHGGGHHGELGV